jgi:hypothetical protein
MGKMSDTPETDKAERMAYSQEYMVPTEFARRLERERDEARHEIQGWKNKFDCAVDMAARAENELAKIKEAAKSVIEIWETPPWKIDATPSKAITQLRDAIGYED